MHQVKKASLQSEMMVPALTTFKTTNTNQKRILDGQTSSSNTESGFSNVPLTSYSSTPNSGRLRRSSNTSIASDVSFLPRYESPTNLYHMQSDLDISASEVEDNASTSSQLGHLTKEQIFSAFQKSQQRYHKYRGRYSDIARHYKDLERENNKIRSVLVETQDKALRRISELREQCTLEQKAKAHLENSLRVDLDEKQYVIDSLKTKVDLLQSNNGTEPEKLSSFLNLNDSINDNSLSNINHESLTKDLKDAKAENELLTAKIQELKANSIVFNSKESDLKKKILELEEINNQKNVELSEILERERENNLIIAQTKMELHTEIQNRDLEIENLKHDVDALKSDLDISESKLNTNVMNKLENFQSQNAKLIEKVEDLTQKCNNYESDLLKMQQYKIENENLSHKIETSTKQIGEYEKGVKEKEDLIQQQKLEYENELSTLRENAKQSLLTLESKIKNKLQYEFRVKEEALTSSYEEKIQRLTETDNTRETQLKLIDKIAEIEHLETKHKELEEIIKKENERYKSLETNHLELISESSDIRNKLSDLQKSNCELQEEIKKLQNQNSEIQQNLITNKQESSALYDEKTNLQNEIETIQNSNVMLQNEITKFRQDFESLKELNTSLQNENLQHQCNQDDKFQDVIKDLQINISQLTDEKSELAAKHTLLQNENHNLQTEISELQIKLSKLNELNDTITELSAQSSNLQQQLSDALKKNVEYQSKLSGDKNILVQQEKVMSDNRAEIESIQKTLKTVTQSLKEAENQKVEAQTKLKEEKHKFYDEIHRLNSEITKFKEQNDNIQTYIEEYKQKLSEYETNSLANTVQLQNTTHENATLKTEIVKLKDLIETSDSINTNLTQQLNNVIQENSQVIVLEELINKHIEDKGASLVDKIKLITELNRTLKEKGCIQDTTHNKLNLQLEEITNENKILRIQISELETDRATKNQSYEDIRSEVMKYEEKCKTLNDEITILNHNLVSYKNELVNLQNIDKDCQSLKSEKELLDRSLSEAQLTIDEVTTEKNRLTVDISKLQEQERNYNVKLSDHEMTKTENVRFVEEISELKHRNNELSLDYKQITAENEEIVTELAETKLKLESLVVEKVKHDEVAKKIEIEKAELLNELKQYRNELDKLKMNSQELENIQELENLVNDNKNLKLHVSQLEERCESCEKQRKIVEGQLRELENQYTEISHEKQLLQDEIQELKISPINVVNVQKLDKDPISNTKMQSNDTDSIGNHQKEIDDLNEKLVQYRSLDLTNRSSIQFYENELQKLKNKNEKLNRKLDETLVTLNHCTELSHSTETEYLKNVLYNYMLGKESIVLARVIAAVCKFDESQTNTILQREQQKQTLLGQLGLL